MQIPAERRKRASRNEDGFTLIEIIISLIVLSIAAVGVFSVFSTGIGGSASPLVLNQAVQLAQGELDAVIGFKQLPNGFSNLASGTGQICKTSASLPSGFACRLDIYYVPVGNLNDTSNCGLATNYKHITVTITQSAISSIKLDTVVANY